MVEDRSDVKRAVEDRLDLDGEIRHLPYLISRLSDIPALLDTDAKCPAGFLIAEVGLLKLSSSGEYGPCCEVYDISVAGSDHPKAMVGEGICECPSCHILLIPSAVARCEDEVRGCWQNAVPRHGTDSLF